MHIKCKFCVDEATIHSYLVLVVLITIIYIRTDYLDNQDKGNYWVLLVYTCMSYGQYVY